MCCVIVLVLHTHAASVVAIPYTYRWKLFAPTNTSIVLRVSGHHYDAVEHQSDSDEVLCMLTHTQSRYYSNQTGIETLIRDSPSHSTYNVTGSVNKRTDQLQKCADEGVI